MKRTLSAITMSILLGSSVMASGAVAASSTDEAAPPQERELGAVKETRRAIKNLRSAVKDFEDALAEASKDENLKKAAESAQSALNSAQRSFDHAVKFMEEYAPKERQDKEMEEGTETTRIQPRGAPDRTEDGIINIGTGSGS